MEPAALSAALASSRSAKMFASVSAGAAGVTAGAAGVATAVESATRALSPAFSLLEHAATSEAAQARANGMRRRARCMGPPGRLERTSEPRRILQEAYECMVICAEQLIDGVCDASHIAILTPERSSL